MRRGFKVFDADAHVIYPATGNIEIKYSCEAITVATNQGYKTRLGWHRLR